MRFIEFVVWVAAASACTYVVIEVIIIPSLEKTDQKERPTFDWYIATYGQSYCVYYLKTVQREVADYRRRRKLVGGASGDGLRARLKAARIQTRLLAPSHVHFKNDHDPRPRQAPPKPMSHVRDEYAYWMFAIPIVAVLVMVLLSFT